MRHIFKSDLLFNNHNVYFYTRDKACIIFSSHWQLACCWPVLANKNFYELEYLKDNFANPDPDPEASFLNLFISCRPVGPVPASFPPILFGKDFYFILIAIRIQED